VATCLGQPHWRGGAGGARSIDVFSRFLAHRSTTLVQATKNSNLPSLRLHERQRTLPCGTYSRSAFLMLAMSRAHWFLRPGGWIVITADAHHVGLGEESPPAPPPAPASKPALEQSRPRTSPRRQGNPHAANHEIRLPEHKLSPSEMNAPDYGAPGLLRQRLSSRTTSVPSADSSEYITWARFPPNLPAPHSIIIG